MSATGGGGGGRRLGARWAEILILRMDVVAGAARCAFALLAGGRWVLGLIGLVAVLLVGCADQIPVWEPGPGDERSAQVEQARDAPEQPATDEVAVEDTYIGVGNPAAEVVVVLAQGGPLLFLVGESQLREVARGLDLEQSYLVNVHQAQTIDAGAFAVEEISFDEAKAADSRSVAMLAAVVKHFQEQGKAVYVVGVSFGAFMVQELLATQGNVAEGYLIVVGRIDMPAAVWTEFAEGRAARFVDGTEVVALTLEEAGHRGGNQAAFRNMSRLAAGLGQHRYSERLAGVGMANVIYVSGTVDEQVGRLTDAERAFLAERGADLIEYEGGHGTPPAVVREAFSRLLPAGLLTPVDEGSR